MEVVAEIANDAAISNDTDVALDVALAEQAENPDFSFLPKSLTVQCRSLIESYHELHGYACLPDMLWKSRLGPFIETHHGITATAAKSLNDQKREEVQRGLRADSDDNIVA